MLRVFYVSCRTGDNTVMALQTARYLIASLGKVRAAASSSSSSGSALREEKGTTGSTTRTSGSALREEKMTTGNTTRSGGGAPLLSGSVRYLTDARIPTACPASLPADVT